MMNSQQTLPVLLSISSHLPVSLCSTKGFVCVSASLAIVPLGCAGPRRQRWQATVCDRPSHPAMITFSSVPPYLLPPFPLPLLHYEPITHLPQWKWLTLFGCQISNSKTSKQTRSSPVQHCRPAARASSRETPHTCWLCTFPERQRQM